MRLLMVPGIGGSGTEHWQSYWERDPAWRVTRIRPASWSRPQVSDWLAAVERGVAESGPATVVVAHSLGCLAVAHLAAGVLPAKAVVLVAPPDVHGPRFPPAATGFRNLAQAPLRIPGLLVSSTDDPYCDPVVAARLAILWRIRHIVAGAHGHLNVASNLGDWPQGRRLIENIVTTPSEYEPPSAKG